MTGSGEPPREPHDDLFAFPPSDGRAAAVDDLQQRYARHLFVLAYHVTGDRHEAARLAASSLAGAARHAAEAARGDLGIRLYRELIGAWRAERRPRPWRRRGRAAAEPAGRLHRALLTLPPDPRLVIVLRVAEGLDYEEIAAMLGMPAAAVRAHLAAARARVLDAMLGRPPDTSLDRAMNLYLDGRLGGPDRDAFETRLRSDAALRQAVEFHRGLTLEFQEEAPAPPRDFAALVRARVAAGESAGGNAFPRAAPSRAVWIVAGGALAIVAAVWLARGRVGGPPADAAAVGDVAPPPGKEASEAADPETIEALRSLGYLASGEGSAAASPSPPAARRTPAPPPARGAARDARTASAAATPAATPAPPADGAAAVRSAPSSDDTPAADSAAPPPDAAAAAADADPEATLAGTAETAAGGSPPPEADEQAGTALPRREFTVGRGPDPGSDHRIVRTLDEWRAFAGDAAPAPEVAFGAEMIVVLRDDPGGEPRRRLVIHAVERRADVIVIVCGAAPAGPEGAEATAPGRALILPAADLPVRVVRRSGDGG